MSSSNLNSIQNDIIKLLGSTLSGITKNHGIDAREKIVDSFEIPIKNFKILVEKFISSGGDINGFCNDGNILQCAIINHESVSEAHLDYLLSLDKVDPLITPCHPTEDPANNKSAETIEMTLYCNKIPQNIINKVVTSIHEKHKIYVQDFEKFKDFFVNENYILLKNCKIMLDTLHNETVKFNLHQKRYDEFLKTISEPSKIKSVF